MIWLALASPLIVLALMLAYMSLYQRWDRENSGGNAYFSAPLQRRRAIRRSMRRNAILLRPFIALLSLLLPAARQIALQRIDDVAMPDSICTPESVAAARSYSPIAHDVIVVTPMKCGTTWMQQLVLQVLQHGSVEITESGHLQASSCWLEATSGVTLAQAPSFGAGPSRVIKSHLPAQLCPLEPNTRYIYVTRDPVTCYASLRDYMQLLYGPFCPAPDALLDWYLSQDMFFSPWPNHIAGWVEAARANSNVLIVSYEDMLADIDAVIDQLAQHLNVTLDTNARQLVRRHTSFDYMKQHQEFFEMNSPNLFTESSSLGFFNSGSGSRHETVSDGEKQRINSYCQSALTQLQQYRLDG